MTQAHEIIDHNYDVVIVGGGGAGLRAALRKHESQAGRATISDVHSAPEICMEQYGGGSIVVSDYNPAWSAMFEHERTSLHAALDPLVLTIEHIGSTAVPGMAAKPIIDLQASVRSLAEAQSRCVERLQALGYTYLPQYEAWLPGELFFRKALAGPWTHHLHILQGDDPRWQDRLLFRDYLRNHPEAAATYAKLKRDLAAAFDDDISGYRNAKDAFVAATMAQARAGR